MTKRTRYFMFGAALVLLATLGTGLVAYYRGGLPLLGSSSSGPEDLAYFAPNTSAVAFANVRDIMDSQFRQKLKQVLPTGEERDKLLAETGIDVERDIDTVLAGLAPAEPVESGALVLVRGRFDAGRIETLVRQHGGTLEEYKGKRLVVMHEDSHQGTATVEAKVGEESAGIGFLEPGLVALGEVSAIKRAIDTRATRENATGNAELMKFIGDVQGVSNAWVVGRPDALSKAKVPDLPSQVTDQLAAVQWLAVSAHVNNGISGAIRIEARDDQSADQLRAIANGALAAARLISGKDAKLDTILNSLQMNGVGKTVGLSFSVPPEILDLVNGVAGLKNLTSGKK